MTGRSTSQRVILWDACVSELIFSQNDAKRCLLGPSPQNKRAIRCYEKCGFKHAETVVSGKGEREYIMIAERPNGIGDPITEAPSQTTTRTGP